MYIDTHCHLDDEKYSSVDEIVERYLSEGVEKVINMAVDSDGFVKGKALSERFSSVYFAIGFHPSEAEKFDEKSVENFFETAKHKRCVGIGEIGLDYHFLPFDKEKQKRTFITQLNIANELNLPFCVHSRDATEDTLKILKENKNLIKNGGVMHCFSGSKEIAREYIKLGLKISFGGTLTFKNAVNLREVCKEIPLEEILTETDSPYLSPEPKRGSVNSPENIPYILGKIAEIKGKDVEETAKTVYKNAENIYKKIQN